MSEHGASPPLSKQPLVEEKYPEAAAEYIFQRVSQPEKPKAWCADDSRLPRESARLLEKRLQTTYSEDLEQVKPLAVEALEKRITHRLNVLDSYLTDDILIAKIEKASLKDTGIYEGIFLDKLLALKGQPVAILRVEDSLKLDELGTAILKEIKQRGLTATLTQQTAQFEVPPVSPTRSTDEHR